MTQSMDRTVDVSHFSGFVSTYLIAASMSLLGVVFELWAVAVCDVPCSAVCARPHHGSKLSPWLENL